MNESPAQQRVSILSPEEIAEGVVALADEISARHGEEAIAFVGLRTRGVTLARRVAAVLAERGQDCPVGTLDVSLYRDDFEHRGDRLPSLEPSDVPFSLDHIPVVLFDEVIYTGRTVRAALEGLMDYGRPARIELAVLLDRGHREVPIQPDYLVRRLETSREQYVRVCFQEDDGEEGVYLETPGAIAQA